MGLTKDAEVFLEVMDSRAQASSLVGCFCQKSQLVETKKTPSKYNPSTRSVVPTDKCRDVHVVGPFRR